jgi:serine/threonine-protein kinase
MFELFDRVVDLPPLERGPLLAEACGADRELRRSIEELLESHDRTGGILEHSETVALEQGTVALPADAGSGEPASPQRFGSYRVVRRLGEGGFGTVYLGERLDGEFEQQVAIKVLRPGHDSHEVLRRFQQERQILARLEHPHIARLLDGGTAADGRPYVVLERVEGRPIDSFCDETGLGVDGRLGLFLRVCDPVQYAHQRLVVHRDLKPGNILVTADGTPKLLDFGIAKLLGAEDGVHTATGLRAFTPRYASPEQVRGETITTASDVYSLGVVLYELLTGRSPYRVDSTAPHELARAVVEEEPQAPSLAIRRAASAADDESDLGVPAGSHRRLRGDLDTIVLKALDKEPARRYGSVQELRSDIERHRSGLPVQARPDTLLYRSRKFVLRNRLAVAASLLVLGLLGGWIATLSVQSARTERALVRAQRVTELLVDVLAVADPESSAEEITAQQLLAAGERRVREELGGDPETRAALLGVIGEIDSHLGLREHAEELLRETLELRLELYGEVHADVVESRLRLGNLLFHLGRYEESEEQLYAALDVNRRLSGADTVEQSEILRRARSGRGAVPAKPRAPAPRARSRAPEDRA